MVRAYASVLLAGLFFFTVATREVYVLACQGSFNGWPATLQGQREFVPYNQLGDGYIRFAGLLKIRTWSARLFYEDYSTLAPYEGILQTSDGRWAISVLDNSGGQMLIYQGGEHLGAPPLIGQFVCRWTPRTGR
jgi:hypothetical protein